MITAMDRLSAERANVASFRMRFKAIAAGQSLSKASQASGNLFCSMI